MFVDAATATFHPFHSRFWSKGSPTFISKSINLPSTPFKFMIDYSGIAVEVWRSILLAVIDVPYVFDTVEDGNESYWRRQDQYHDEAAYKTSEQQRRLLAQVCASWRAFADEHKHRWIIYKYGTGPVDVKWKADLDALQAAGPMSSCRARIVSRPRRIMFQVGTREDFTVFRNVIDYFSSRVTTLYAECSDGYEDAVFGYLINQSDTLSSLRCLMVREPSFYPMHLRSISRAFPNLIALAVKHGVMRIPETPEDSIILPDLEALDYDLSTCPAATLETLQLPRLVVLSTTINQSQDTSVEVDFYSVKQLGFGLRLLNLHELSIRGLPMRLPSDFWTWCPSLVELMVNFSSLNLDSPAPVNHPLKYLVHWPTFRDLSITAETEGVLGQQIPVLLHNLQLLPTGFQLFVVSIGWPAYDSLLGEHHDEDERHSILARINEISSERFFRVEDQYRMSLDEYLRARRVMIDIYSQNESD